MSKQQEQQTQDENFNPGSFLNYDETTEGAENNATNASEEVVDDEADDIQDDADNGSEGETEDNTEGTSEEGEEDYDYWGDEDESDEEDSDDSDAGDDAEDTETATTSTAWQTVAQEAGIEAETEQDFLAEVKRLKEAAKEVEALKQQMSAVSEGVDPAVKKLNSLLKLDDESLVKENLKAQGFEGAELEEEYQALEDAGEITREALAARRDIKIAIKDIVKQAAEYEANKEAIMQRERDTLYSNVNEALSKIDNFMGIKLGKDEKQAASLRGKAFDNYKSGKMFSEMTSSPEAIAQLTLLWSMKDKLGKMLESKGANRERKRIVTEDFGNAENKSGRSGANRQQSSGFNPSEFLGY